MSDEEKLPGRSDIDEDSSETAPTITAVFRYLRSMEAGVYARFDKTDGRIEEMNGRLDKTDGRIEEMNGRLERIETRLDKADARLNEVESRLVREMAEGFKRLGHKLKPLNNRGLEHEGVCEDLSERIERLESNAT